MNALGDYKFCFFIIGLVTFVLHVAQGQTSNCPKFVSKSRPPPNNQVTCELGGQWFYIRVGGTDTHWRRGTNAVCLSTYDRQKVHTGTIHGIYSGREECFFRWSRAGCERLLRSKCRFVQGQWGNWGNWQERGEYYTCKENCGSGEKYRTRTCENGYGCEGDSVMTERCNKACTTTATTLIPTTSDGTERWSNWEEWGACSEACGEHGSQTRSRKCIEGPCMGQRQKERKSCANRCRDSNMHTVDTSDISEDCESIHNKFRQRHTSTDEVDWDAFLTMTSHLQAKNIALNVSHGGKMLGENVFIMESPHSLPGRSFCKEAIGEWYSEARRFNYDYGENNKYSPRTKHFSQVVWNTTTDIGCGQVTLTEGPIYKVIVVCHYYPPGNVRGQFKSNVYPPKSERKLFERRSAYWASYPSKAIKHVINPGAVKQSWESCEAECIKTNGCHGYSWLETECYLWPRGTTFRFTTTTERWSTGILLQQNEQPKSNFERRSAYWANYPSKTIKHVFNPAVKQNWDSCEAECIKTNGCHGYSWFGTECYLWPRGTKFRFTTKTELWSTGILIQPTEQSDSKFERIQGNIISSDRNQLARITTGCAIGNWEGCESACLRTSLCKGFSWSPGTSGTAAVCNLWKSVGSQDVVADGQGHWNSGILLTY